MSDDPNAAAPAAGDTAAAPPASSAPPPADTKPAAPPAGVLGGAVDDIDGEDAPQVTTTWPDDWRERWAGSDEQALKTLKRWATPDNVFKSWMDLRKKQGAGLLAPALPEGASEEEVTSYRKSAGIPETPDGYELAFPEGIEPTDDAKAELATFAEAAHALNAPPALLRGLWGKYLELQQQGGQQRYEQARAAAEEARVELRAEYGRDYTRNVRVANGFISQYAGGEKAAELVNLTLADGRKLGDNPDFVRFVVAAGLGTTGADQLVSIETEGGGKTLDEQIREEMDLMRSDPRLYDTPERETKRLRLFEARRVRDQRQGQAA